jgi:ABC-2 type transport system ATP-binding protein
LTPPHALETFDITKRYGVGVLAVDRVSVRVGQGEIYGFLGLNGAGKSTTIRMILGMIAPTKGHAELFGSRVRAGATELWRKVGYLVDTATAYPELTVRENLEVARRQQFAADRGCVARIIDTLALSPYADRRARTLSLGNLQRLALARALLHGPELLILDEPANGLDPAGVVEIRDLLQRLSREQGVTVFMSSHVLAEVERLATRIGILHRGRLVEELDASELERKRERRLEIGARDLALAETALLRAGFAPGKVPSSSDDRLLVLEVRDARALAAPEAVASILCTAGVPPRRLVIVQEDLEKHFLRVTEEAERELR